MSIKKIQLNIDGAELKKKLNIVDGKDGLPGAKGDKGDTTIVDRIIEKTEVIKEVPNEVTGEEIVNKINDLPLDDDKKIDASHIKNLPEHKGSMFGGKQNLWQLNDVSKSIAQATNGQVLKKNGTTGLWEAGTDVGGVAWGGITGTLSNQTDLQTALNAKQATLVSGTNIKTINSTSLLGSGDIAIPTYTSPLTTKGDLFGHSTVDARIPVGSNGKVLTADSTASVGVSWQTPATGTVTSVATAGLISGGTITSSGTITTSMSTNKLVGRGTSGTGVMEEITLGTNLSLSGTTLNAAGGSPGGSNTNMQFNDSSAFGGADVNYLKDTHRTGFQVAIPKSTLHVGNTTGTTIAPPTTLVLTYSVDTSVDNPATATATQVDAPTNPSTPTVSFIQIDYVNAGSTSQNLGGSGYIANGQTIDYRIYGYRYVNSVPVVHPTYYSTSFTDAINDGSTPFDVDISSIATSLGNYDGFIIQKQISGGGYSYSIDAGASSSFTDSNFSNTDAFETSAYAESGASWNGYVAQYKTFDGTSYRTSYINGSNTDANAGQYLILNVNTWGALADDGFIVQHHNSYYFNIGTATSYYDYGQTSGSVSDLTTFSSVAFPQFSTSMGASSSVTPAAINYTGSTFFADGSTWDIEIWDYRTNPNDGLKYYASSAVTGTYGTDDNSSNGMTFDGTYTPAGDADGQVVKLLKNSTVVHASDIGTAGSWNIASTNGDISVALSLSSYTGLTRQFNAYGYITSPSLKYSTTNKNYSFTDNNPTGGYVIAHAWATPGSATGYKVLETSYRGPGSFFLGSSSTTDFTQLNTSLGDATVTPNTVGFSGDGTTYYYDIYSYSSTLGIYSAALSGSTTLPNDSQKYLIDIAWTASADATSYKGRRKIGSGSYAYKDPVTSGLDDDTTVSWVDNSTLTPTTYFTTTSRFDGSTLSNTDPLQGAFVVLGASGTRYAGFSLGYATAVTDDPNFLSHIYTDSSAGALYLTSLDANIYQKVNRAGNAFNRFGQGTVFNLQGASTSGYYLQMLSGGGNSLFKSNASDATNYFGNTTYNYDPTATVAIQPSGTDTGIILYPNTGVADTTQIFQVKNSSASTFFSITNIGKVGIGVSSSGNGNLRIGSANSSYTQLLLDSSGSEPSSPVSGGMMNLANSLYWTDDIPLKRRIDLQKITALTGNTTLDDTHHTVQCTGTFTVTLPTAVGRAGIRYIVKAVSGTVTVLPSLSQTIEGISGTGYIITTGQSIEVQSNGANWIVSNSNLFVNTSNVILDVPSQWQFRMNGGANVSGSELSLGTNTNFTLGTGTSKMLRLAVSYVSKTANYTLTSSDVAVNATSNTFAFTLPTAVGHSRTHYLKNSGTGVITINTTSSQTIDGLASGAITLNQYDELIVLSNGANWIITSWNNPFGYIRTLDGTAALPTQTFSGDLDTGFYRVGANNLGLSLGGTLKTDWTTTEMNIADGYNIKVGTTTGTKIGTSTTQKLAFYNQTPIVQPTALTTQLTTITATAPGTPDYAIQDLTNVAGYGFVTADEGQSVLKVILNLQTRVAELETKLKALGLLA